jgi:glutaredoxin
VDRSFPVEKKTIHEVTFFHADARVHLSRRRLAGFGIHSIEDNHRFTIRQYRKLRCSLSKVTVVIYSRPGCHLCEEAKQQIISAKCESLIRLQEINIESDESLLQKYRNDIPVITVNGVEAFRHRLTASEFSRFIHNLFL